MKTSVCPEGAQRIWRMGEMKRGAAMCFLLVLIFIAEQTTLIEQWDERVKIREVVEHIHGPQGIECTCAGKLGWLDQRCLKVSLLQSPAEETRGRIVEFTEQRLISSFDKLQAIGADPTAKITDDVGLVLLEQWERFGHIGRTMAAFVPDHEIGKIIRSLPEKLFALLGSPG